MSKTLVQLAPTAKPLEQDHSQVSAGADRSKLLSVIIPALNEAGIVDRLIQDLLVGASDDTEIIVCDSNSDDDTALIVSQLAEEHADIIRLVKAQQRGVSLARNLAAAQSRGRYLAFLDADARITMTDLKAGIQEMERRSLVAAAFKFRSSTDYVTDQLLALIFNLCIGLVQYLAPTAPGSAGYLVTWRAHSRSDGFNESMHFGEDVEYLRRVSSTGRFRILRASHILWDMRRFHSEGRLRVIWKMLYGTVAQMNDAVIEKVPFTYKVGHFQSKSHRAVTQINPTPKVLAQAYQISAKRPRLIPAEMASGIHFLKSPLGSVDLLQLMRERGAQLSPYCLDDKRRCVLFVETAANHDLLSADPFFYEAQRDAAERLYAVPYGSLKILAEHLIPEQDITRIFLQSTGRCGSTLVSQLLGAVPTVMAISEPDIYSQAMLIAQAAGGQRDREFADVLQSCSRLLSYYISVNHPQSRRHFIKLRSWAIFAAHLLPRDDAFTQHMFLYREPLPTINSFLNAYFSDSQYQIWRRYKWDAWLLKVLGQIPWTRNSLGATVPLFNHPTYSRYGRRSAAHYFALQWLSHMQAAQKLKEFDPDYFSMILKFEDIKQSPYEFLVKLSEQWADPPHIQEDEVARILSQNSQVGSRMQSKGEQLLSTEAKLQLQPVLNQFSFDL
ncbi:MAG TPA: hypothetical protein DCZ03_13060 [Gammaproteobacteria bacterium]|nr:hypothetical protein [Gammaproteobacteria bacterium]